MKAASSLSVLLVEDHEDSREAIKNWLEWKGWRVFTAGDQKSGLALGQKHAIDLLICDLQLPDGDGWEFVQRLAADPRTRQIPVVMLTACATEAVKQRARHEGVAAFFFKPCSPDVLAAELRRLIAAREHSQAV